MKLHSKPQFYLQLTVLDDNLKKKKMSKKLQDHL